MPWPVALALLAQGALAARHQASGPTWSSPDFDDDDDDASSRASQDRRPVYVLRGALAPPAAGRELQEASKGVSLDLMRNVLEKAYLRYSISSWNQGGKSVTIWGPGGPRFRLGNFSPGIRGVRHFPADERILTWTWGGVVVIWDASTGLRLQELHHQRRVSDVRVFPKGDRVVCCDWGGGCTVWRIDSGVPWLSFSLPSFGGVVEVLRTYVDVFPDGERLLVRCMEVVRVVSSTSGDVVCESNRSRLPVFFSSIFPDGGRIIAGTLEEEPGSLTIWSASSCAPVQRLAHRSSSAMVVDAAVFDRGELVATLASLDDEDDARESVIWRASTGELLHTLPHEGVLRGFIIRILPLRSSNRMVVMGETTATLWDVAAGEALQTLRHRNFGDVVVSPGGDVLVSTHEDEGMIVWDLRSARKLHAFNWIVSGLEDDTDDEEDWLDPFPKWRCGIGVGRATDPQGFGRGLSVRELPA